MAALKKCDLSATSGFSWWGNPTRSPANWGLSLPSNGTIWLWHYWCLVADPAATGQELTPPFMTFVIFHEESQHFRKGDETDTKCITKWTPFWTMEFSCRFWVKFSAKNHEKVFIPDGVALFGPWSNVGSLHRPGTTWVSGSTSRICWLAVTQKQNACSYGWNWFNVIFAGKKRQTMANPYLLPRLFAWALIAVLQSWSVAVTFAQCCSYQVEAMVHIHCLEQFELCYLFLLCGCAWLLGLFRTGWTLHCTSHRNLYHL